MMISVEEALKCVLDGVKPLEVVEQPISEGVGKVVAETLVADTPLPPFDNSAMDGYAIRSCDVTQARPDKPVRLYIIGEVPAGKVFENPIHSGEAVKIMTGAQVPSAADSVVMIEEARLRDGMVEIRNPVSFGKHIRRKGEDISAGEKVLARGTRIRIQHLGLLASLGRKTLRVYRTPSASLLTTGSELVDVGQPLPPGKIHNTNSMILRKLLERSGAKCQELGTIEDDPETLRKTIQDARKTDLLVISGGVSVGKYDYVKEVLQELGMKTLFWRVNMKPGKPILFGRLEDRWVFGLPGNPISCVVCFFLFVQTATQKMMGIQDPRLPIIQATLTGRLTKQDGRRHYLTARLEPHDGSWAVTPTEKQGSGMLASLSEANAFIIVPEEKNTLEKGERVNVLPFGSEGLFRYD